MEGVTVARSRPELKTETRPGAPSGQSGLEHRGSSQRAEPKRLSSRSAFSRSKETYISLLAASAILLHLVFRYALHAPASLWLAPLYATLVLGGLPLVFDLARKAIRLEFGSDLLAGASILTSVALGEYLVGSIVVLMLSGGVALENYATRRASSVLDVLARRMPLTAHRKQGEEFCDVKLDEVGVGDTLIVFPHEICPVDGSVVEGHGVMDEAYLTGEPFRIAKAPGSQVLSGAINGDSALTIVAEKLAVDSRYAMIMQVVQQSEQDRPEMRRLGDRLGAWYTPLAVGLAALSWVASGDSHRFLAVMVVATPCPLLIAIPVAVIAAISLSARRAIIIKNAAALEQVDTCQTLIFDKTGTLTYGRPALTEILCAPEFHRDAVLRQAASLEVYSKHPLASAITTAAQEAGIALDPVSQVSEKPGEGLRGIVADHHLRITGRNRLEGEPAGLPPAAAGLECLLFIDEAFAAVFRFRDAPRKDSQSFVRHLSPRHKVTKVILLSGDRESEVRYLADSVGIDEAHFEKSPEEKVAIVKGETLRRRTLFVGDGINDAPGLLAATVGVAFGQNSDITSEAADAVVLEASLRKIDELIHIGHRMRVIALQSAIGGMALSILGMIAAALGYLPPIGGAVAQEIIDLAAVLNAIRVALPPGNLTDF
ncbi:MAG TPA: heavy metal translocating P-type ATPase [Terriglobia bacterium]|nr:heavy metal translocating P-type ATPase [Terriglobia bacterium]